MMRWNGILIVALLAIGSAAALADDVVPSTSEQIEFFEKHVRPILVSRCYECHSTDADEVRGGLRLDSREGWVAGGDSGPAIVPSKPDESLLIAAIRYEDDSTAMPPKGKLPAAEIEILTQWVQRGAPDPRVGQVGPARKEIDLEKGRQHWAYQPIRASAVPGVRMAEWPRNDIDRFILARQEAQGLTPGGDAEPEVLIRRVYFDLIGLPPTPEEVDAFVKDCAAETGRTAAYERLVNQLLASSHFGERWGRHWLDVARYAESLTLRGFIFTDAWRYRDYVIESFNQDRPFDQMMMEQVAGDLLPAVDWQQSRRQVTATAFLALGNTNLEEQDKTALVMDVVDEQIDTISKAFLAQTVTCARCHDHKFDPIPTADYYALAGILKSTRALNHSNVSAWIQRPLAVDAERETELVKQEALVRAQEDRIKQAKKSLAEIAATPTPPGDSPQLKPVPIKDLSGIVVDDAQAKRVGDWTSSTSVATYVGEGYIHDANSEKGTKTVTFIPELPASGQYEVRIAYPIGANRATNTAVTVFSADGEFEISLNQRVPGDIDGRFQKLGRYRFEKAGQSFVIVSNAGTDGVVVADAVQFIPVESLTDAKETQPTLVISAPSEDKEGLQKQMAAQLKTLEADLKQMKETGPRRDQIISVREDDTVGDTQIHIRGNVHNLGEKVPRGFLRVLPVKDQFPISAKESGRLQLAQWLAHPDNPLPARVMVNRVWHHLFGVGLVRTVDNFGTTGETPSHPELLDYLAIRYRESGMSTKSLIREIVLSRTYQLASEALPDAPALADPENRLLTRANRRRLDAECIRDAMLLASGQLDLTPGGPSYKPDLNSDFDYKHTDTRRSVYSSWFRNGLPEVLEAFDVADSSVPSGRRNVSTVATQALFMLNHPWVGEQATAAARKLLAESGLDDAARLDRAFRVTVGRSPTSTEREISLRHVQAANSSTEQSVAWATLLQSLFASIDFRYVE